MKQLTSHNILVVELEKVKEIASLLNEVCTKQVGLGKKTDNHWILNTMGQLNPNGMPEVNMLNMFLHRARMNGYQSIMVTNKKAA